jgi:integrase
MAKRPVLDLHRLTLRAVAGDGPDYRWRAEWYPPGEGGQMKTRSLGARCPEAEALRRGAVLLEEGIGLPDEAPAVALVTAQDLLEAWMGAIMERPDLATGTRDMYRFNALRLARMWGAQPIADVDGPACLALRAALQREHRPSVVAQTLLVAGIAWRWALEQGLVLQAVAWPRVRAPRIERHTPDPEHVEAVLALATGWPRLALALAWSTGARVGELVALDWGDLDLRRPAWVRLRGKTGARQVPLAGAGLDALLEVPPAERVGRLRGAYAETTAEGLISSALHRLADEAGVPRFTVHGVRRLAVDTLARSQVDVATAAALTGHSVEVMLRHYRQVNDDDRLSAVARAQLGQRRAPSDSGRGGR